MNAKNYNKIKSKDNLVTAYLEDIKGSKSKPLTKEEEKELLDKYYNEDTTESEREVIRKKITMSHQRFIYDLANCYANNDNNLLMELISIGTIGFYETFDNFDITKGIKFITYAQYYVRRAIKHFLDDESLMVRPANNTRITPKVKKIEEEYLRLHGVKPDVFEVENLLEEKYGITLSDRNDIFGAKIERIEDSMDTSDDDYSFEDAKEFTDYSSVDNDFAVKSENEWLTNTTNLIISKLPEREAKVLKMAYGLGEYNKPSKNEDIGDVLDLSAERVRQIKKNAEKKFKSMFIKVRDSI